MGAIQFIKQNGAMACPKEILHSKMRALAECLFNAPATADEVSWHIDDLANADICAMYEHHAAGRIALNEIADTPGVVYVSMGQGLAEWYQSEIPEVASENKKGKKMVNERMAAMLQEDPRLVSLSAVDWAEKLDCSATAVKLAKTWKKVLTVRAMEKADRVTRKR